MTFSAVEALALITMLLLFGFAMRRLRTGTPRRSGPGAGRDPRATIRAMAARGVAVANISHDARVPYDVVTLAMHLARARGTGQKVPSAAAPAARRQKTSV